MARTELTVTTLQGAYGAYGANEADVTMAAADVANGNTVEMQEGDILLAHNTGGAPYYLTIDGVADPYGRDTGIEQYDIDADELAVFGPYQFPGWRQSDGGLYIDAENAAIRLGVLRA